MRQGLAALATVIYLLFPFALGNIVEISIFVQLSRGSKHDSLV